MNLKDLTPEEKLDLIKASAYRCGETFGISIESKENPASIIARFKSDLNRTLDLIEEMGQFDE